MARDLDLLPAGTAPKKGDTFTHRSFLDPATETGYARCHVTNVSHGKVFYRFSDPTRGAKFYSWADRFATPGAFGCPLRTTAEAVTA